MSFFLLKSLRCTDSMEKKASEAEKLKNSEIHSGPLLVKMVFQHSTVPLLIPGMHRNTNHELHNFAQAGKSH